MPASIPVVVIGISGVASSGKSTLSNLLSEIFSPWSSIIIEESDFIVSKSACPLGFYFDNDQMATQSAYDLHSWNSIDVHRLVATIQHVKGHGTKEGIEDLATHATLEGHNPEYSIVRKQYLSLIANQQKKVGSWVRSQRSTSPGGLLVDHGIGIDGFTPVLCFVNGFALYTNPDSPGPTPVTESFFRAAYPERSSSLPDVAEAADNASTLSLLSIASRSKVPTPYANTSNNNSTKSIPIKFSVPVSEVSLLQGRGLGAASNSDQGYDGDEGSYESGTETPHMTTPNAKRELNNLFHTKIFLPTSKAEAKKRRFKRTSYMDPPHGTRRPEEFYKNDSYFEDILWANYVREQGWMFSGNHPHPAGDIFMPGQVDVDLETSTAFVVDVILNELYRQLREFRERRERRKMNRRPCLTFEEMEMFDVDLGGGESDIEGGTKGYKRLLVKCKNLRDRTLFKLSKFVAKFKKDKKGKGFESYA